MIIPILVLPVIVVTGSLLRPHAAVAAETFTVPAAADGYVSRSEPDRSYGTSTTLKVSPKSYRTFLRFPAPSLPSGSTVTGVSLAIFATSTAAGGFEVHPASGAWTETTLTYNSAPVWNTTILGQSAKARADTWMRISLPTSVVTGLPLNLAVSASSPMLGRAASRETTTKPQLELTFERTGSSPTPTAASGAAWPVVPSLSPLAPTPSLTPSPALTPTTPPPTPSATSTSTSARPMSTASTTTAGTGAPAPQGPPGTWGLAFQDEFNGTSLDQTKWVALNNWRMNNVTAYSSNVAIANGNLILTLASSTSGAFVSSASWDGAGANSYSFPVGDYIEARVYFPGSANESIYNWPAWWTSGPNWPAAGEHDVAEGLGGELTVNYHSPSGAHNQGTVSGPWGNGFHTYGLHRLATRADVYWDGVLVKSYPTDDSGAAEALLLNVGASTSRAAVTGAAGQVRVDYVRAWRPGG